MSILVLTERKKRGKEKKETELKGDEWKIKKNKNRKKHEIRALKMKTKNCIFFFFN